MLITRTFLLFIAGASIASLLIHGSIDRWDFLMSCLVAGAVSGLTGMAKEVIEKIFD